MYIKEGQPGFSRHILTSRHKSHGRLRLFLFSLFFLSSINITKGKKAALNHPERACQQVVSSRKSSYAHIRFPPSAREIPLGSGSPFANTNWKRDPPVGGEKKKTTNKKQSSRDGRARSHASSGETSPTTRSGRRFDTERERNLRDKKM